jgi:hypothetical protein
VILRTSLWASQPFGVAGVELHEAHAALDHPPREQAARAELARLRLVEP